MLLHPQHEDAFLQLAKGCDAVICCRVSPMQKAQVRAGGVCVIPSIFSRGVQCKFGMRKLVCFGECCGLVLLRLRQRQLAFLLAWEAT